MSDDHLPRSRDADSVLAAAVLCQCGRETLCRSIYRPRMVVRTMMAWCPCRRLLQLWCEVATEAQNIRRRLKRRKQRRKRNRSTGPARSFMT